MTGLGKKQQNNNKENWEKRTPTEHCTHLYHHAQLGSDCPHVEKDAVLSLNNNFSLYTMTFALKRILTSLIGNSL